MEPILHISRTDFLNAVGSTVFFGIAFAVAAFFRHRRNEAILSILDRTAVWRQSIVISLCLAANYILVGGSNPYVEGPAEVRGNPLMHRHERNAMKWYSCWRETRTWNVVHFLLPLRALLTVQPGCIASIGALLMRQTGAPAGICVLVTSCSQLSACRSFSVKCPSCWDYLPTGCYFGRGIRTGLGSVHFSSFSPPAAASLG